MPASYLTSLISATYFVLSNALSAFYAVSRCVLGELNTKAQRKLPLFVPSPQSLNPTYRFAFFTFVLALAFGFALALAFGLAAFSFGFTKMLNGK